MDEILSAFRWKGARIIYFKIGGYYYTEDFKIKFLRSIK